MSSQVVYIPHPEAGKFTNILQNNGITCSIASVLVLDRSLKGEGFASTNQYIKIIFEDLSKPPLNFFVKVPTSSPIHRKVLDENRSFKKEAEFFMKFVPVAQQLCTTRGLCELIDFIPKCYYADESMIVLENLCLEKSYTLLDKEELQGMKDVKFAISTIAKFHAVAHAVQTRTKKFSERFPNLLLDCYKPGTLQRSMIEPVLENGIRTRLKLLEESNVQGKDEAIATLKEHVGNVFKKVDESLEETPYFCVLNHGDYWKNNLMFLKDSEGCIVSHKVIDMQQTRFKSPGVDLGYYLYSSVQAEVRRSYLKEILGMYFSIFSDTSAKLKHPLPKHWTFENFFLDYRHTLKYGFWFSFCITNEVGYAVFDEMDMDNIKELSDWAVQFQTAVDKWMTANPDKLHQLAENTVLLLKEYKELVL